MFCTFGTQIAVYSMPALLKCGLVPLVANAILDVLLSIILGSFLSGFLGTIFEVILDPLFRECCFTLNAVHV
jgi:hypothetical protein